MRSGRVSRSGRPSTRGEGRGEAILALDEGEAAELIGKALPEVPGTRPYLTRGLYMNPDTGDFAVYLSEGRLVVHHGSLGASDWPMQRRALVLQLEVAPTEVYVHCSMAR